MPVKTQEVSTNNLSVIYDRIYDIADRLFKKHNPCNIHTRGKEIVCNGHKSTNALCCYECNSSSGSSPPHYWENGCTIKCLPCKLFVCCRLVYEYDKNGRETRNKKYKSFVDRIYKLRNIASKYGINTNAFYRIKNEILKPSNQQYSIGGRL